MDSLKALFTFIMIAFFDINLAQIKLKKRLFTVAMLGSAFVAALLLLIPYYGQLIGGIFMLTVITWMVSQHGLKLIVSIFYTILAMMIGVVVDSVLATIFLSVTKFSPTEYQEMIDHFPMYILFTFMTFVFGYIVSGIIGKIIRKINFMSLFQSMNRYSFMIVTIIILTFGIIYVSAVFSDFSLSNHRLNLLIFTGYIIALGISMYIMFSIFIKEERSKQQRIEMEQLIQYTSNLESMYQEMRKFRHDYMNILSSMIGYMDDNNMDGLKEHFNNNILPFSNQLKEDTFKLGRLSNIEMPEMKGIVSSKLIRAQELGVDIYIDISEPVNKISMNMIDLCRVVGILLDNAVEAARETEKPMLKFGLVRRKHSIVIAIINSCSKEVPPIYKIYEKGFSTKGEGRGLGLANLKEVVDGFNNCCLDTSIKDGEFTQELEITDIHIV